MNDKPNVTLELKEDTFYTEAIIGEHSVPMDEPIIDGGTDLAPSPKELAQAALAGCIAMTLRIYANHKGWELGKIDVEVSIEKENNQDIIYKKIKFGNESQLSDEQKKRLQIISTKCPVSKMFSTAMVIKNKDLSTE